jgi:hypothetical protein
VGKAFINRDTADGFAESVEATALLFGSDDHRTAVRDFLAAQERRRAQDR